MNILAPSIRFVYIYSMEKMNRRKFVDQTAKAGLVSVIAASTIQNLNAMTKQKDPFIHHVYFWLDKADSKEDLQKLVAGLKKLQGVKSIKTSFISKPADTSREVIDSSYSVSWLCLFDSKFEQDSYQVDPIHLKFVDECKHLWKKVTVYDSVSF